MVALALLMPAAIIEIYHPIAVNLIMDSKEDIYV